jgi:hypothetical protein
MHLACKESSIIKSPLSDIRCKQIKEKKKLDIDKTYSLFGNIKVIVLFEPLRNSIFSTPPEIILIACLCLSSCAET